MGFNIVLYGLGSKKLLLEKFRTTMLSDSMHMVVNGFFPSITLKSVSFSFYNKTLSFQKKILSNVVLFFNGSYTVYIQHWEYGKSKTYFESFSWI